MATKPDIVLRAGKPAAVILNVDEYEELLERVEDVVDLKRLRAMRKRGVSFKSLRTFRERKRRV